MPHIIIDNNNVRMKAEVTETVTRWVEVASETGDDYARLAPVALRLLALPRCRVAVIGLGFGILPRLLCRHHQVAAYEIEQGVVGHFRRLFAWATVREVVGDFTQTLPPEQFDWIVYDLGGPAPEWLSQHGQVIVP